MGAQQQVSEQLSRNPARISSSLDLDDQPTVLSSSLALTPRSQFESYMRQVKRTAILAPEKLTEVSRNAYIHRFGILKTLAEFPPCVQALADQFEYHQQHGHKLYNFVTGYGDQSVAARDGILHLNQKMGKGGAEDRLQLKKDSSADARLRQTLQNLVQCCNLFKSAEVSVRRSSDSALRRMMSDTYLHLSMRFEEYERHCKLFEDISYQYKRMADALFSLVDPADHDSLLDSFSTTDVDAITSLVPPQHREHFRSDAARLHNLIEAVGLSVKDVVRMQATYQHHKDEQAKYINQIVQANLLLSAREAIRANPAEDRLFDTCQEANEGLIVAAYRFEYWRGWAFSTSACYWITQRLLRHRDNTVNPAYHIPCSIATLAGRIYKARASEDPERTLSSLELSKILKSSVAKVDEAVQAYTPLAEAEDVFAVLEAEHPDAEALAARDQVANVVRSALDSIEDTKKREICQLRWGIGYPSRMTLAEVSKIYGITRERVRIIEKEGLDIMRAGEFGGQLSELNDAM